MKLTPQLVVAVACLSARVRAEQQHPISLQIGHEISSIDFHTSTEQWEKYINDILERWHMPGMAVAVINGTETWAKGFGYASLDPPVPVTPHTLFYAGSTTKSFVAAALSLLIDNSSQYANLAWTTPISQLLRDDFVLSDDWATAHITLEDALSHRTGYPRHDMITLLQTAPRSLVRSFRHLPMTAEPRAVFQYNNMMYDTAAFLLRQLAGCELGAFLHRHLWAPWGMNESFIGSFDPELRERGGGGLTTVATGYWWLEKGYGGQHDDDDDDYYLAQPDFGRAIAADIGAGGVLSNVNDYVKYLRVMMAEEGPISKQGHRELKRPRSFMDFNKEMFSGPGTSTYALGWMGAVLEGEQVYWHTGTMDSFTTFMLMIPSKQYGIVVMGNANSHAREIVPYRVLYDLLQVPEERRRDFEEHFRKQKTLQQIANETCSDFWYPAIPHPAIPSSVPLESYAGTYHHPAYQNISIGLECAPKELEEESCRLKAHLETENSYFSYAGVLEHKSAEFWLAHLVREQMPALPQPCVRAQFAVDVEGSVTRFGLDLRSLDEEQDWSMVWFDRV